MKEFVEKLIERLEEESYDSMHLDMSTPMTETWQIIDLKDAIKIAKDLASEHNNGFCEWEDTESLREKGVCYSSDGLYKPSCNDDEDDFGDWNWIRHFEFCPYCGKKIKVAE